MPAVGRTDREPVLVPHTVIVQDATSLHSVDLFAGLRPGGYLLVNSTRTVEELGTGRMLDSLTAAHVDVVPASRIALEHLGRPLPGPALLRCVRRADRSGHPGRVLAALGGNFPGALAEQNAAAARAAHDTETARDAGSGVAECPSGAITMLPEQS